MYKLINTLKFREKKQTKNYKYLANLSIISDIFEIIK